MSVTIADLPATVLGDLSAVGHELREWRPSSERGVFAASAVAAVLIAVALAHALQRSEAWWVAISSFAVMQAGFGASLLGAVQRVLGTLIGAGLGLLAFVPVSTQPWLAIPILAVIAGLTVYRANVGRAPYAVVLGGVTALMVTEQAYGLRSWGLQAEFASHRVVDVLIGVSACVLVSGVACLGMHRHGHRFGPGNAGFATASPRALTTSQRQTYVMAATWAGIAVAIYSVAVVLLEVPGSTQALVTIVAVSVLPPATEDIYEPLARRMRHRVIGCLLACAIGYPFVPIVHGHELASLLALAAGVWVGTHLQTGARGVGYVGRQFSIAFIMIFVQDHGWSADPQVAASRLFGIIGGVLVLLVLMTITPIFLRGFRLRV